jgi:UDP-N-acetylmuramate--alanine ligase
MRKTKHVHFIGIGGIGVSALARYFLSGNYKISGSDASRSEITDELKKEGVKILIGHKVDNVSKDIDLIIHSAAVNKDNPEIKKAGQWNIPLVSYAEALGELTRQYKTIAVSGTHGKSTTTAMLSLVFAKAGLDPTVIVGTKLKEFGGKNFRKGKGDYLIIEADEYFKSFLNYSPLAAIITNIDRDHLDFYKNIDNLKKSFLDFIGNIYQGGILIANKDDKNLFGLENEIQKIVKKNKLKVVWYGAKNSRPPRGLTLNLPGKHNISNATAVYGMSRAFGVRDKVILKALNEYRGAWRRMEHRGKLKIKNYKLKIDVYDDYAHHPTEIKATLAAFRQKYPKSRIICVFQPHQEKRLRALFKEFSYAFNGANNLILLDIYKVKGRDEAFSDINSRKLTEAVKKRRHSPAVLYLKDPPNIKKEIEKIIRKSRHSHHVIVMMGAGDIYKLTDKLLK